MDTTGRWYHVVGVCTMAYRVPMGGRVCTGGGTGVSGYLDMSILHEWGPCTPYGHG